MKLAQYRKYKTLSSIWIEFQKFLTILSGRSVYDFQVDLDENDKILTLSSCYNDTLRVVLHAKLVGIEERDE